MLTKDLEKKIVQFVYKQPVSIQEIARFIHKNWRTANSYVDRLIKEGCPLGIRIFREGTRGALKLVFYKSVDKVNSSEFQERLFKLIEAGKKKQDFSPFDIYNYVHDKYRSARCGSYNVSNELFNQNLVSFLRMCKKELLIFTGNCSFVNLQEEGVSVLSVLQELAESGIVIKVLSRVDFSAQKNIQQLLSVNYVLGKEVIDIRHCEQPLRGFLVDDIALRLKEDLDPSRYKKGELPPGTQVILYDIRDSDWVRWAREVFFVLFRTSVGGQKRLTDLRTIKQSLS
jgi:hypothetical protein